MRIQYGRVFVPGYRFLLRSSFTLPWLIGVLSLFYISIAVFLTVRLFDVRSDVLTVLIAGIFTVNITVTATAATYIHDLDCDMLSLALAVFAVYLWKKYDKGFLYGMIPLCLSIGLYQAFISTAITLILLYLIMQLLDGEPFAVVFKKGIRSIGMLLGGGVLYFLSMKAIGYITGIALVSGEYNSMDTVFSMSVPNIISTACKGYKETLFRIKTVPSLYPQNVMIPIHFAMVGLAGIFILLRIFQKEIKVKEKILTLILIALLPIGMDVVYTLTGGISHDLMHFAMWLVYLFVLLVAWRVVEQCKSLKPLWKYGQRAVLVCLISVVLWGNVQTANAAYLKKDIEQQANLSLFTRVVDRMENYDGYVTGTTPVVFVGEPGSVLSTVPGFDPLYLNMTGCWTPFVVDQDKQIRYSAYFDYALLNPAVMADPNTWDRMHVDSRVTAMPCYPTEGSVAIIDGVMVVKLGESD